MARASANASFPIPLPASLFEGEAPPKVAKAGRRPKAVLVVHGMGQQVPFATLGQVYEGLRAQEGASAPAGTREPLPFTPIEEAVGDAKLRGIKVVLDEGRPGEQEVHVYEAYWAPVTEGKVTLRDTMAFLGHGAVGGLKNSFGRHPRWLFNRLQPAPRGTAFQMLLASLVMLSVIGVAAASTLFLAGATAGATALNPAWSDLTWLALAMLAPAGLLGLCLGGSLLAKRSWSRTLARRTATGQKARVPALGVLFDVLGTGAWWLFLAVAAVAAPLAVAGAIWIFALKNAAPLLPGLATPVLYGTWALLVVLVAVARRFLVQAVGDVAAYVSTHRLDRFEGIRSAIKRRVRTVANAIYDARGSDGAWRYGSVAIVGHSLGSAVAYNTLNDLISDDALLPPEKRRDVLGRTPLLLTFGSPLSKLAFIYATQAPTSSPVREAMAGLLQPLVRDYAFRRKLAWVNVHASADLISGKLRPQYDDAQDAQGRKVQDIPDPHARTPLLAHNEYWRTPTVWRTLRGHLMAEPGGAGGPGEPLVQAIQRQPRGPGKP